MVFREYGFGGIREGGSDGEVVDWGRAWYQEGMYVWYSGSQAESSGILAEERSIAENGVSGRGLVRRRSLQHCFQLSGKCHFTLNLYQCDCCPLHN